ncbi:GNAT family N-acetyltransferase [Amycolatopsis sp.]|jgi:ribosomal protein S18 acetylase RimI-like enzyme|uniref:GNAT family N-acetyltransferase n=1 Tax=Amycolatopsis sp. TaxID=37632 RepID=UPI002DFA2C61|nr:GNAT family N-acetyltransferase [Amycolatopsis sp.]
MNVDAIAEEHASRLTGVDPLLPELPVLRLEGDGELLSVVSGDSVGTGLARRDEVAADSRLAAWQARVQHRLDVRLAGPAPEAALDELLTRWDEHLGKVADHGDTETAAVIARPSRDATGSAELLTHGFAPVVGIAVRPAERMAAGPATTPGVCIRAAELDDLATAVRLQLELTRYDAQFGMASVRPDAEDVVTRELKELLEADEPTVWIAELYGEPLGMVQVQLPGQAGWIEPYTTAKRVGYLSSLAVAGAARSSGVGTALAGHAHQVFDDAGADVVLLHHALANPLSTPFWYAQGYRPLWTYWQRRPAVRQ